MLKNACPRKWASDSSTEPNDRLSENITSLLYVCTGTTFLDYFFENQVELSYEYTIKFDSSTYYLDNDGLQKTKVL